MLFLGGGSEANGLVGEVGVSKLANGSVRCCVNWGLIVMRANRVRHLGGLFGWGLECGLKLLVP